MRVKVRKHPYTRTRRPRVADIEARAIHDAESNGIAEALAAGLPTIIEKYGYHSYEVRSAQRLLEKLTNTAPHG